MTYEELLISIDLNGYENVLSSICKTCLYGNYWFVVCDEGDCHLFDRYGKEDDIKKVKEIYEGIIPRDIKKIVIPDSVMSIADWAFYKCNRLKSIMIPDNVTSIEKYVFSYCNELASITIPKSVMSIKEMAFYSCSRLTSVTIPDNVTSIGYYAFSHCSGLTSVAIGNNVMTIGELVFKHCNNLKSLIFKGKSLDQIRSMKNYPFGIEDESIIECL